MAIVRRTASQRLRMHPLLTWVPQVYNQRAFATERAREEEQRWQDECSQHGGTKQVRRRVPRFTSENVVMTGCGSRSLNMTRAIAANGCWKTSSCAAN